MGTSNEQPGNSAKGRYSAPVLTVYGTVRDLTGASSGTSGDGTAMMAASDPAYKENVIRVGEHPAGFGLYLFDYKAEFRNAFGHGRKFGVMADEVEAVLPAAVSVDADGYRAVNYGRLGIVLH